MIDEEILLSLDRYQFYYLRLNGLLPGQKAVPYYSWHCKKQRIKKVHYQYVPYHSQDKRLGLIWAVNWSWADLVSIEIANGWHRIGARHR